MTDTIDDYDHGCVGKSLFEIRSRSAKFCEGSEPIAALWHWQQYRESQLSAPYTEALTGVAPEPQAVPIEIVKLLDKAAAYLNTLMADDESPGKLGCDEHVVRMFGFETEPGRPHPLMEHYRDNRDFPIVQAFMDNDCNVRGTATALGIDREEVRRVVRGADVDGLRRALEEIRKPR